MIAVIEEFHNTYNLPTWRGTGLRFTDSIERALEDVIFRSVFHNGIHISTPEDGYGCWAYQLTYYKGGYYTKGLGDTRQEALLDQLITIYKDPNVEQDEKDFIYNEVRKVFNV